MNKTFAKISIVILALISSVVVTNSASAAPSDAIPCVAGTYSSTGYASVTESVVCILTPPGTYQDQMGGTAPIPCPAGTYSSVTNALSCLPTTPGTYAGVGSAFPSLCQVGTFSGPGAGNCTPASAGHFVAFIQSASELPCSAGTYQPLTGQSFCHPSQAGTFVADSAASAAVSCPAGTYQPSTNSVACIPAPLGKYVDVSGAIQATDCPINVTTSTVGATSASDCNVSTVVTILGTPNPGPTPTPTPIAIATPMPTAGNKPVALLSQNVASLKIPKSIKTGGKFTVAKISPAGLPVKIAAKGSCSVVSTTKGFIVTAAKQVGNCTLKISSSGNGSYLPLSGQVTVKVTR